VRAHVLAVLHLKLIILFDVYTMTPKRRLYKPFLLSFKGKMLNAFVKVNMVDHMLLVAVCYCFWIKLN
jgi:hypothetical protein